MLNQIFFPYVTQIGFFQIQPKSFHYVVLNQKCIWCFSKRAKSERSCRITSDSFISEGGWADRSKYLEYRYQPVTPRLKLQTKVQLLQLCTFNLPCPGQHPHDPHKYMVVMFVPDTKITESRLFFQHDAPVPKIKSCIGAADRRHVQI